MVLKENLNFLKIKNYTKNLVLLIYLIKHLAFICKIYKDLIFH